MIALKFYVYAYLRDDGTPYYIGKGHGKRAWNKHIGITVPTNNKIVLLESNLTEVGAFALERRYIRWYGRKDLGSGILRNLTDGGDGATGKRGPQKAPRSPEHIAKLVAAAKERMSDPVKRRQISMSLKGTIFSEERKIKLRGRKQSLETITKRINKNTGKKRSPEQVERIRLGIIEGIKKKKREY